jgi:hypothetical protein
VLSESAGTLARDDHDAGAVSLVLRSGSQIPDFKTRTLVGNAVVRWEYRPGSALFFVWQQRRLGFGDDYGLAGARDLREVFSDHPQNIFAVKGTYWLRW